MKISSSQLAALLAGIAAIISAIGVAIQQNACLVDTLSHLPP